MMCDKVVWWKRVCDILHVRQRQIRNAWNQATETAHPPRPLKCESNGCPETFSTFAFLHLHYIFCVWFLFVLHCVFELRFCICFFLGGGCFMLFLSTHSCVGVLFLILYRSRLRPASASSSSVPSFSPGDIDLRFAWQAWYRWSPGATRHFAWQAWYLATWTFHSRGWRDNWRHRPSFRVAGVTLAHMNFRFAWHVLPWSMCCNTSHSGSPHLCVGFLFLILYPSAPPPPQKWVSRRFKIHPLHQHVNGHIDFQEDSRHYYSNFAEDYLTEGPFVFFFFAFCVVLYYLFNFIFIFLFTSFPISFKKYWG